MVVIKWLVVVETVRVDVLELVVVLAKVVLEDALENVLVDVLAVVLVAVLLHVQDLVLAVAHQDVQGPVGDIVKDAREDVLEIAQERVMVPVRLLVEAGIIVDNSYGRD